MNIWNYWKNQYVNFKFLKYLFSDFNFWIIPDDFQFQIKWYFSVEYLFHAVFLTSFSNDINQPAGE